ncbi:MAG: AAC(3) family N-acetyltransferase [Clostridia bacterium]|nr:AAC(3) family N-acetyltransferase [Clostridia bacterium]
MVNEKMARDLRALGIKNDDVILMHSSLRSLGFVEGGADSVIDTLLSVLENGTLLIPTLSYASVTRSEPIFSIKETPSCVGKISEVFRKRDGVIRSVHPTHSVCGIGKYAEEILSRHIDTDTPAGENSPFALLPKYNGKVLMLGCGLDPNTSMHGVEELVMPDYLLRDEMTEYTLIDADGNERKKKYWPHYFHGEGFNAAQRYHRLANVMDIAEGKVLEATAYLIDAKTMWDKGYEALKMDSHYFVEIFKF